MNQIKKDLDDELQSITLSEEKKQEIIQNMHVKNKKRKREQWSYRFVLTAFTLLALGFSYLLFTGDIGSVNHTAQPEISEAPSLFAADQSKMLLMIGLFIVFYTVIKMVFKRQGRTLPTCADCGEEWSFGQSLKGNMLGEKSLKCPHCLKQQVKSEKAIWEMNLLNFLVPFGIILSQLFDRVLLGFLLHATCALLMMALLGPYLLSFKDNENVDE